MDYARIYNNIVERAQTRIYTGYTERHHIIPKCVGGPNDKANLVRLTPEEHYVAHQLLVKMYPGNIKLVYAAHMMGNTRQGNKSYGWLKRRVAAEKAGKPWYEMTPEISAKLSEAGRRYRATDETKAKLSASCMGRVPANKGKPMSEEQKAKLRKPRTEEQCKRISEAKRGKSSDAILAHAKSLHEKAKGKPRSEETKAKIAAGHMGKTHSEETKAKMKATRAANRITKKL